MSAPKIRVPDDVLFILHSSRMPWRIILGSRHLKIVIAGKIAGILPKGHTCTSHQTARGGRAHQNLKAQLRRVIKEAQA